jgi:hypothetical protein
VGTACGGSKRKLNQSALRRNFTRSAIRASFQSFALQDFCSTLTLTLPPLPMPNPHSLFYCYIVLDSASMTVVYPFHAFMHKPGNTANILTLHQTSQT